MRAIPAALAMAVLWVGLASERASAQVTETEEEAAVAGPVRLRIVEPPDGAIIPGSSIRVVIARDAVPGGTAANGATVFVFLDGSQQSSLLPRESRLTIDNVAPGRHRVSVLAIDRNNQIVDRQDVSVQTVGLASGPTSDSTGAGILSSLPWDSVDAAALLLAGLALAAIAWTLLATRRRPRRTGRLGGSAAGRLLLVAAALAASGRAQGQSETVIARQNPIVAARSASLSDPTGTYTGVAMLTIENQAPALQVWRIDLQAQPCPECQPGQYFLAATNFSGINFVGDLVERGGVRGSLDSTGKTIDLTLTACNCLFVSPSGSDRNYGGRMWGGSFGETPGNPLVVANGAITGRISGRDCFGRSVIADVTLQRQSTTVPAPCASIQGMYAATYNNPQGVNGGGSVSIVQDDCFFAAQLPGIGAQLEGVMTGPGSADIHVRDACAATVYEGTLSVAGNTVQATYTGATVAAASACPAGTASGTFTLTHQ
jgi:hypothetical protein